MKDWANKSTNDFEQHLLTIFAHFKNCYLNAPVAAPGVFEFACLANADELALAKGSISTARWYRGLRPPWHSWSPASLLSKPTSTFPYSSCFDA